MFGKTRVYLDVAAAAPVSERARRAFISALPLYGNPSAAHTEGVAARTLLEEARTRIARLTGAKTDGVIFTSGATEANHLAILGSVYQHINNGTPPSDIHVLYAEGAHASTKETMQALTQTGVRVERIGFVDGKFDMETFMKKLCAQTVFVSLESVAPETGVRINTRDVRRALESAKRSDVVLHVDASQSPLVEIVERTHYGADLLTLDAQKVGGVRGIGALIRAPRTSLAPISFGGVQEQGIRSGTPSPAHAISFATALEEVSSGREKFIEDAQRVRKEMVEKITESIAEVVVNEGRENAPHVLNLSLMGRDTDYLVALLDEAGFAVSTRSACESDEQTGSRGVLALTKDTDRASATLRVSWGLDTSANELTRFTNALIENVAFLDQHKQ